MSLAKMKRLTAMADEFNGRAEQFAAVGRQLVAEREALVAQIRETGILKDEAEGMVAKVKYDVTLPDSEEEGGEADQLPPTADGSQADAA